MFFPEFDDQISVHFFQDDAEGVAEGGLHVSRAASLVMGEDQPASFVHYVGTDHTHLVAN